jgi:DNA replication protein DnaC
MEDLKMSLSAEFKRNMTMCPKHALPYEYKDMGGKGGRFGVIPYCSQCDAEYDVAEKEKEKAHWDKLTVTILSGSIMGIPERFKKAEVYDKDMGSGSVFITGACGTGKSHLAASMAKRYSLDSKNITGLWVNFQEMAIMVKTSFRDDTESMDDIIKKVIKQPFLIMDDIGTAKPTESAIETLYMITNQRYERMMQTIYTTNLSLGEMAASYGDRVASRLSDCKQIKLEGKDRRVK